MTDAAKDYKCSPCEEYKFFLYDPNDGITFWRTAEERDKAAEDAIDSCLDEEWNEEVSGVFAGMATHNTVEINRVDRVGELDDDGYDEVGEYWANSLWDVKCSYKLQPIPQPDADHAPGVTKMVGDGEREELAALIEQTADSHNGLWPGPIIGKLYRAAALLRQPAPALVQGWQPISTAPQDGTEILASDYDAIEIVSWDAWETGSGWIDRNGQRLYPAWWQPLQDHPPIPQPPQGGDVEE